MELCNGKCLKKTSIRKWWIKRFINLQNLKKKRKKRQMEWMFAKIFCVLNMQYVNFLWEIWQLVCIIVSLSVCLFYIIVAAFVVVAVVFVASSKIGFIICWNGVKYIMTQTYKSIPNIGCKVHIFGRGNNRPYSVHTHSHWMHFKIGCKNDLITIYTYLLRCRRPVFQINALYQNSKKTLRAQHTHTGITHTHSTFTDTKL